MCNHEANKFSADPQGLPPDAFGSVYLEEIHWAPYPALGPRAQMAIVVGVYYERK